MKALTWLVVALTCLAFWLWILFCLLEIFA